MNNDHEALRLMAAATALPVVERYLQVATTARDAAARTGIQDRVERLSDVVLHLADCRDKMLTEVCGFDVHRELCDADLLL